MDGWDNWDTIVSCWDGLFSGAMLVLGSVLVFGSSRLFSLFCFWCVCWSATVQYFHLFANPCTTSYICHLTLSSWWLDVAHQILHCEKPAHAVDTLKLLTCASKNSPLATAASFEARVTEYNQQKSLSSPAQIELHPDHEDRFGETWY